MPGVVEDMKVGLSCRKVLGKPHETDEMSCRLVGYWEISWRVVGCGISIFEMVTRFRSLNCKIQPFWRYEIHIVDINEQHVIAWNIGCKRVCNIQYAHIYFVCINVLQPWLQHSFLCQNVHQLLTKLTLTGNHVSSPAFHPMKPSWSSKTAVTCKTSLSQGFLHVSKMTGYVRSVPEVGPQLLGPILGLEGKKAIST